MLTISSIVNLIDLKKATSDPPQKKESAKSLIPKFGEKKPEDTDKEGNFTISDFINLINLNEISKNKFRRAVQ